MQELKELYDSFKDSGDLKTLYPEMTGNWEKDQEAFRQEMIPAGRAFKRDNEDN